MHITTDIKLGTEKQLNVGILANVTVYLWNEEKTAVIFQLEDFCIRRSRAGQPFVAGPQREYTSQGQKRYRKIVKVAPQEPIEQQDGYRARFESFVMGEYNRALQQGGAQPQTPTVQAPAHPQAPAPAPAPPPAPAPAPAPNPASAPAPVPQGGGTPPPPPPPPGDGPAW
jgi:hypothetical protein